MRTRNNNLRLTSLDFLRGCLIFMMIIYHLFWDLGYFGYINFSYVINGMGLLIAQCIGASFIFLSGISISLFFGSNFFSGYLFLLKLTKILGISAAISLLTWLVDPERFIFFGILHLLSVCYFLAFCMLRIQKPVLLNATILIFCLFWISELKFDLSPVWVWIGVSQVIPSSNDFYPLIPWCIFFFIGIRFSNQILRQIKKLNIESWRNSSGEFSLKFKVIVWAGKKSLIIYICHQPLFFSLFLAFNALKS